jgi:hypothetical protein
VFACSRNAGDRSPAFLRSPSFCVGKGDHSAFLAQFFYLGQN